MDISRAFAFVFEDEDWIKKILLGALISLIPIVGQFVVTGYAIAVLRNVKAGAGRPLPEWGEFSDYLVDGLKFWVVTLVYAIPIMVVVCPLTLVWVVPVASRGNEDLLAILSGIAGLVILGLACLAVLYGVFLALLTPVLRIRYAETGQIGACLRLGDMVRYLGHNVGSILVAALVAFLVGGVVTFALGAVSLGLLALPATVWMSLLSSHLYGQIARGGEPSV